MIVMIVPSSSQQKDNFIENNDMQSVFRGTFKTYVNKINKCFGVNKDVVICRRVYSLPIQNTYPLFLLLHLLPSYAYSLIICIV
jgi:hypothetical protein